MFRVFEIEKILSVLRRDKCSCLRQYQVGVWCKDHSRDTVRQPILTSERLLRGSQLAQMSQWASITGHTQLAAARQDLMPFTEDCAGCHRHYWHLRVRIACIVDSCGSPCTLASPTPLQLQRSLVELGLKGWNLRRLITFIPAVTVLERLEFVQYICMHLLILFVLLRLKQVGCDLLHSEADCICRFLIRIMVLSCLIWHISEHLIGLRLHTWLLDLHRREKANLCIFTFNFNCWLLNLNSVRDTAVSSDTLQFLLLLGWHALILLLNPALFLRNNLFNLCARIAREVREQLRGRSILILTWIIMMWCRSILLIRN